MLGVVPLRVLRYACYGKSWDMGRCATAKVLNWTGVMWSNICGIGWMCLTHCVTLLWWEDAGKDSQPKPQELRVTYQVCLPCNPPLVSLAHLHKEDIHNNSHKNNKNNSNVICIYLYASHTKPACHATHHYHWSLLLICSAAAALLCLQLLVTWLESTCCAPTLMMSSHIDYLLLLFIVCPLLTSIRSLLCKQLAINIWHSFVLLGLALICSSWSLKSMSAFCCLVTLLAMFYQCVMMLSSIPILIFHRIFKCSVRAL